MGAIGVIGIYFSMPKDILRTKVSIEKVIQDYKSILSNRLFLKYALSFGFIISSFFIWIVEGPFVIIEGLKLEPSVFGWMQVLIFGSFGIGAQLAKRLIKKQSVAELVRFSMMIIMGGACAFMLLSLVTNNLYWIVSSVVMISVGASMAFGSLNRLAIEASEASMGNRTAAFSLLVSAVGTFASFVLTLFNNITFLNLSVVMAVFIVGGVALIWPKSKKIRFSESS
jgi:hypothetical protein